MSDYVDNILAPWLVQLERLAPNHDVDAEGWYFSSIRITWLDYLIFETLESNCDLVDYKEGHQVIGLQRHLNCSQLFGRFPRVNTFFSNFKERPNIKPYITDTARPKHKVKCKVG